jgi:hypothetical protein
MIAVIYRGFIYPQCEEQYKASWKKIADYFKKYRGAHGSMLHKTPEGEYIAYSLWPDLATRNASWGKDTKDLDPLIQEAINTLKQCLDTTKKQDEICMELVENFLIPNFDDTKKNKPARLSYL